MQRAESTAAATLLAVLLVLPSLAAALDSDRNEPVYIEADKATLDEQSGTSSYSGNVTLQQGTLRLHGSSMTVQMENDRIVKITLQGKPARFAQRAEDADSDQEAEADYIEYNATTRRLLLEQNALIRQTGKEEFSSDRIEYNLSDNSINAGGTEGRVRITLQPERGSELIEADKPQ